MLGSDSELWDAQERLRVNALTPDRTRPPRARSMSNIRPRSMKECGHAPAAAITFMLAGLLVAGEAPLYIRYGMAPSPSPIMASA